MTMRSFRCRHWILIALVCLTLVGVGGLTRVHLPEARADGRDEAGPKPALRALDPVLLTEGKEVKGRAEFSLSHDGFRYVFVDAGSKAKFEKDRERYAVQFHGK